MRTSLTILFLVSLAATSFAKKPNIIVFLADDLGYNEISANGQTRFATPNIDRLARDGVRFTQFYSGHSVCAPSRCTLLTGKHTGHAFVRENSQGTVVADRERIVSEDGYPSQLALQADEITIAEILKSAGYQTACVGKWGLGHPSNEGSPNRQGFDFFYGFISQFQAHNHYPAYLWRNDRKETLPGNDGKSRTGETYAADAMEKEALAFIRDAKDKPFFLYFATPVPHLALQVPGDEPSLDTFIKKYEGQDPAYDGKNAYLPHDHPRAAYAAMVTRMDRTLGRMRKLLEETGQADNTIIVFTSDNGATYLGGYDLGFFGGNLPFKGHKGQFSDGGIRVPCIITWPGTIPSGKGSDAVGANWDFLPTLAAASGGKTPPGIDGINLLPTLVSGEPPKERILYWESMNGTGSHAIRAGEWKAVRQGVKQDARVIRLFRITRDIAEENDLAPSEPQLVERFSKIFADSRIPSTQFPMGALDGE